MRQILSSFVELMRLQSEMNKLFEALQEIHQQQGEPDVTSAPPYDILETTDEVLVEMDLSGIDPSTLRVSAKGDTVNVRAERRSTARPGLLAYHLMERDRGPVFRRLRLEGAINTHKGEAVYRLGVLTIAFPRVPDRRGSEVALPVKVLEPISKIR